MWIPIAPSIHHWILVICENSPQKSPEVPRSPQKSSEVLASALAECPLRLRTFAPSAGPLLHFCPRSWTEDGPGRMRTGLEQMMACCFFNNTWDIKKMECSGWLLNIPGDSWCLSSSWEMDVVWMEHAPHTHRILWPEVEFPLIFDSFHFWANVNLAQTPSQFGMISPMTHGGHSASDVVLFFPHQGGEFSFTQTRSSSQNGNDQGWIDDFHLPGCVHFVAQEWGTTTWYNEKSPVESSGDHWIVNHWQIPFAWAPKVVKISASTQPGGKKTDLNLKQKYLFRKGKNPAQICVNCVSIFRDYYYPFISHFYPHCIPWIPIWMVDGRVNFIAS